MKLQHFCLAVSFLAGLTFFTTCKKHDLPSNGNPGNPNYNNPNTPNPVLASVAGTIVDENDDPVTGVTVRASGKIQITNPQGYFRFDSIHLDKEASVVIAEHPDFFKAYRVFSAGNNDRETIRIKLIAKQKAGTLPGNSGGSVTLADNAQLTLGAGALVNKATNQAYNGTVSVYAVSIDPTAADIGDRVPGSFLAVDKNNQRVVLQSYGMMNIELQGSGGEQLQLATGKKATVKFTIPTSQLAQAPATIPLWSVDEATGLWKDENLTATKQGNFFVGDVTHFSSWNCDISIPTVELSFTIRSTSGDTLRMTKVKINTTGADSWSTTGYSDLNGQVSGNVPLSKPLHIAVLDNCGHVAFEQDIPPLDKDKDLGIITVNPTPQSVVTFKGTVTNCSGQPLAAGTLQIFFQNQIYFSSIINGSYSFTTARCPDPTNAIIYALDQTGQRSVQQVVLVNTSAINVPVIQLCGTVGDQFINYSIDNVAYSIKSQNSDQFVSIALDTAVYIAGNSSKDTSVHFVAIFSVPPFAGSSTTMECIIYANGNAYFPVNSITINITHYAANIGEYIEGNFSASFTSVTLNKTSVISCTFKVLRIT